MDDSFGPRLLGHFDFTLLFEHTMFHIIPSSIIIFATPYYISKILRGTPIVRSGLLLWLKLALAAALIGIQIANAVLWSASPLDSRLATATAILSCVSSLCISILVYAGHTFFLQPLPFLAFFLSVTVLFDIVTTWTYFNRTGLDSIARVHIPIPVLKLSLICLEEVSKRSLIRSEALRSSLGQEAVAGFWNRSLLVWANSLLLFGFRQNITQGSLPRLGPQLESEPLYREFRSHWDKASKTSKFALLKACAYTTPWTYLYIVLPRLLSIGFDFAQPFLLQDVVSEISSGTEPSKKVMRGLILATTVIYIGKTISKSWYMQLQNQIMTSTRGVLISAIYHKSLRLSADDLEASAAVTLMTADVSGVGSLISLSYDSWGRVLEMCCGIAILGVFVGAATLFSVIPAVVTTVWTAHVARNILTTRKTWNERIETRVAATSNILAQIRDVKMLGLTRVLANRLQRLFNAEVDVLMVNRKYVSETLGISAIAEAMTPVLVVAATLFWTRASESVSAARFFTVLALVTLVTNPLFLLLHSLGSWSSGFACLTRIQEYLNLPEVDDFRDSPAQLASETGTGSSTGAESRSSQNLRNRRTASTSVILFAAQISHVSVCTDLSGSILSDISLDIPVGKITMIYGAVGCGKSTLLKMILGEVKIRCGTVTLASPSVAYCGQMPWIQNTTIRNNIVCGRVFNAVLYQKAIYICALDADLARLTDGDQTLAGTDGGNLSGGQKQRISLARALYSEAELIIMDDVFSALDMETSSTVRIRLFSESDIMASGVSSIVMATSIKEHLVDADHSYEIDDKGTIGLHTERERQRALARESGDQHSVSPTTRSSPPQSSSFAPVIRSVEGESEQYEPPEVKTATESAMRDNVSNSKYGDWSLYKYFLKPAGLSNIILWTLVVAAAAVVDRMPPIFARIWLDHDAENRLYFIGFAILGALCPVLYYFAPLTFYRLIIKKSSTSLHWELADATSQATFEFLTTEDAGALLNRFSQDVSMATQQLPAAIFPTVWGIFSLFVDVVVIATGANYALPIIPLFILVLFVLQHFYLRTSRQLRILELDSSKNLVRHVTESGTGIEHIRAFQLEQDFAIQLHQILDETQKPFYFIYSIQQWLSSVMGLTTAVAAVCVVSLALNFTKSTSAPAMGLALLSLISFSDFTGTTIRFFVAMENTFGAVSRIRNYAKTTPREKDEENCPPVPEQWPLSGKVDLNCVSAVYKPESEKPHIALENITLSIQPGQMIGLVGRTGSGKSSVLLAMLHLLEYTGSIFIDGRELRTVPRNLLRTRITTITQDGLTLKASVRFNMDPFEFTSRPGHFPTDETLAGILRRVGLWDHVVRHGGLDVLMSEMKFSVGQGQLFQLARAILHKQVTRSSIVLMDEVTASMDEGTEQRMHNLMNEVFAGCTRMIISHRPAVLADADFILDLKDGRGDVYRGGGGSRVVDSVENS